MPPTPAPFTVVQVGSLGVIGDNVYRRHERAAAWRSACAPGWRRLAWNPSVWCSAPSWRAPPSIRPAPLPICCSTPAPTAPAPQR
ncbi:hypothetical protein [Synechococcus sp. RedBA-s]|uniref:hypothetical protein n=1 Tax=Synechococcus sp. RedBA-s TaxID=2823741 RepID=UPI0020CD094D|nr:hypothetical protein [Synechococcus sp. RedBA-s]MCP9801074.1 hypothetical protein [Synechococcus sp. RedBA-s]